MRISFTSNLAMQNSMRQTVSESQSQLLKAQTEVSTGTFADQGIALGYQSGRSVNLTAEKSRLNSIVDSNSIVSQRLSASQSALGNMSSDIQTSMNSLIALSGSDDKTLLNTTTQSLQSQLDAFISSGNTSANGEFLFSGINTANQPLKTYDTASAAKASFNTALTNYMSANGIGSMSNFTVAQMQDFVENNLAPMYTAGNGSDAWKTDWSAASDTNMTSRVNTAETVQSSTNANNDGFRKFALASVLGVELLGSDVTSDVRQYISKTAIGYMGEAVAGVDAQRSALGLSEARVKTANDTMTAQVNIVETAFNNLNEVDAYEASTKVNNLLAQMEASYQLTSRLQKLSLANYLS
ncbi:flagellar hook-associated family protein [Rhizobium sp. C4]|uniref:flagellar hook-associated family protein n=1 Tax=Rhizobium sp. C4 TaxID=1349800 RepID=UPI001E5307FA|nr:flagellar hook-associated family protein [Rhizobium sp. C4]MCD2172718.1 flagellar hook-associated family protein [Rhizobium sp. C4]